MTLTSWIFVVLVVTTTHHYPQISAQPASQNHPTLRGLTSLRSPFVEKDPDGRLKGYFVDLLDELAAIGHFNYTLIDSGAQDNPNDGFQNRPTGLINEVFRSRADFAIADYLYRTVNQQRYVDFSEPYLESNLSALIHKDRMAQYNIKTIDCLLERQLKSESSTMVNEIVKQQEQHPEEPLALGTIRQIYRDLSVATDPLSRRIYEQLHKNSDNMADNRQVGIERALNTPYAFIQESINNELAMDKHCELTHIKVESPNFPITDAHYEYGIVGLKYSTHLETFNRGIRELKANGRLDELKRRYWNRKCNNAANSFEHYRYLLTVLTTLFSLFMSLFILS